MLQFKRTKNKQKAVAHSFFDDSPDRLCENHYKNGECRFSIDQYGLRVRCQNSVLLAVRIRKSE